MCAPDARTLYLPTLSHPPREGVLPRRICGQAPSDYPEIAADLVRLGIDSISVNPDTVVKTTLAVLEVEDKLAAQVHRDVA